MHQKIVFLFPAIFIMLSPALAQQVGSIMGESMSELCEQMQTIRELGNVTIPLSNLSTFGLINTIGMDNLLKIMSEEQKSSLNISEEMMRNLTEEDLKRMGFEFGEGDIKEYLQNNPFYDIAMAINKTTTLHVFYNKTECIQLTMNIDKGNFESITIGHYNRTELYIKVDLLFVEEIMKMVEENKDKTGISAVFFYMGLGKRLVGALLDGSLVVSPIWGIFDIYRAFMGLMNA